jgi:hypothetical protein
MSYSLVPALLRNGAILLSLGVSLASGICLARTFSISLWPAIIVIHLTCAVAFAPLLLTESFVSRLREYLHRHGTKLQKTEGYGGAGSVRASKTAT